MGSFDNTASGVVMAVWNITGGVNTVVPIASSGCYAIGDTNKWGWSAGHIPFSGYHKQHYLWEMTTDTGEEDYGEFHMGHSHSNLQSGFLV